MCDIQNDIDCYFNRNKEGNAFIQYQDEIDKQLLKYAKADPTIQRFAKLYETRSTTELMALIDQINAIEDYDTLYDYLRKLQVLDVPTLFYLTVTPFYGATKIYCLNISEPGIDSDQVLGYQSGDVNTFNELIETLSIMYMMLQDYGINAGSLRNWIYHCSRMEVAIATHMLTSGEANNPVNVYNSIDSHTFFETHHPAWKIILPRPSRIICYSNLAHLNLIDKLLSSEIQPLKFYLIYCVLKRYGVYTEIQDIITTKDPYLPTIVEYYGNILEQYYDRDHLRHVDKIKQMFRDIIDQAKISMPELTPKLDKMMLLVGSQNYHTSIPPLTDSFYLSLFTINASIYHQKQTLLDKPVHRDWLAVEAPIYSFQINAYYEPISNLVYFPTAMLLLWNDSPAHNYGGIGSVIAHEIVHAFDTFGRLFDSDGVLREWLPSDIKKVFTREASKVDTHYKLFRLYGEKLFTNNTLAEDIADIIGIKLSLRAYQTRYKLTKRAFRDFMNGWASVMRDNSDPSVIKRLIPLDVHSPGVVRINAPFSHIDEYYQLFDVKPTDKGWINPQARVTLV